MHQNFANKLLVFLLAPFLVALLGVFFHSPSYSPAFADEATVYDGPGLEGGIAILKPELEGSGIETEATLIQAIMFWTKILLIICGVVAFVAFVWAGFLFITSFASEENQEKAKKIMIYAGIGIIVILLAFVLTNFFIKAAV